MTIGRKNTVRTPDIETQTARRFCEGEGGEVGCCTQVTYAWSLGGNLQVYRRHTGPLCAGVLKRIDFKAWFKEGRYVPVEAK